MEYFEGLKKLIVNQFSTIAIIIALIMLIINTIEINSARKPSDSNDPLNKAFGLNVASLVFLSLFVINHYVSLYTVKK